MGNMPELTRDLNEILAKLQSFTAQKGHEYILPEHLLYLLLQNPRVKQLVENIGADENELLEDLENFFNTKLQHFKNMPRPVESLALSRIINTALARAMASEKKHIDVIDVFVALFEQEKSHARHILRKNGIDRFEVIKEISWGDYNSEEASPMGEEDEEEYEEVEEKAQEIEESTKSAKSGRAEKLKHLRQFAVNLTELAKKGKIDPIIGREKVLERVMQALNRRKKNNPLLVGEPGVGKTAVVEGLALKIARGETPEKLRGLDIWAIDMGSLIAGTKFRGEFEERLKKIMTEVKELKNAILFIDEMHTVVGAGAVSSGSLDASNILKPMLNSGEIKCVGATTYEDYKNHILKDKAFSRRFQKIDVPEPSDDDTLAILRGLKSYYEEHYDVTFSDKALEAAVRLSKRHINDKFMPDKAIDVIDEAGAKNSLKGGDRKKTIAVREIENIVAEMANIPALKVSTSDVSALKELENNLKAQVFGQDEAVRKTARAIKIAKAGIGNKNRPIGSFLFCGPTGCGKTELAKQLAACLHIHFVRFDMSEYAEKHTVSKLIGSPPGYVGFEQSGLLTEALIRNPHSVVLFDEIEKAHPDIYNILLQIMDYGTLTDNNGRKADFKNSIIIMTSNVGARELDANAIGFSPSRDVESQTAKAVEKYFSPEFRNRLDATLYFNKLTSELTGMIVDKFIRQLDAELKPGKITLTVSHEAREWFAKHGFDEKMGARPLERVIRSEIQEKIADEILFGELVGGGEVIVNAAHGKITVDARRRKVKGKPLAEPV